MTEKKKFAKIKRGSVAEVWLIRNRHSISGLAWGKEKVRRNHVLFKLHVVFLLNLVVI